MSYYRKTNLFLILFSLGLITFLGVLSFTSIQSEIEETKKIDAFFASFEDLNQFAVKDTIKPKVVTYSQLKNFNENDNYLQNRKDISKSVSTYSKTNKTLPTKKHYDVSSRISTYSETANSKKKKKYDVSKLVTVYKETKKPIVKKQKPIAVKKIVTVTKPVVKKASKKINKKPIDKVKSKKTIKKPVVKKSIELVKPKKTIEKEVVKKPVINKKSVIKPIVKKTIPPKKEVKHITKPKVKKQHTVIKKNKPILKYKNENTPTLHYKNKVLNTATNINYIQSAPIYPDCDKNLSEDEKKSCLLTSISKFVLQNFNNEVGKKAGLKKGFYEIRVLFVIGKNGYSKTYKVLGKYNETIKNEIRRIINDLPKMVPGKSNGNAVSVKYSVKVLFEVKS